MICFVIFAHHVSLALVKVWFSTLSTYHILNASPLPSSRCDHQPLDPRTAGLLGRLAIESPVTGCEPNAIVDVSITEVTLNHRPPRRLFSRYTSGEDVTSAPVSSEVGERQRHRKAGFTAAHAQEWSKWNPSKNLSVWKRKCHVTLITYSKHGETCWLTQTEIEQRHKSVQGRDITSERIRFEQQVRNFSTFRADEAVEGEQEALSRDSEAKIHTRVLLE